MKTMSKADMLKYLNELNEDLKIMCVANSQRCGCSVCA